MTVATVGDPLLGDRVGDITTRIDELREGAPILWWRARQAHLVLRYDDVRTLLHDPTMLGSIGTARRALVEGPRPSDHMMIRKDGEEHFRLRVLVQRAFTPRAVKQWGERAQQITDELLDLCAEKGRIDALADYAWPLPVTVISTMLGVPRADVPKLAELTTGLFDALEPFLDADVRAVLEARRDELTAYLVELVAEKRRRPGDDLLTALLQAQEGDDRLTDDEVVQQTLLLYGAGHETTTNLVANGLAHLLRDSVQRRRLQHAPYLDANAAEEVLRFEPPALFSERRATAERDVGGTTIAPGDVVVLGLRSANHDPRRWGGSADVIDVTRADARDHVAFGGGPHHCLGASLARLEASISLPAFLRRFPTAELVEEPQWLPRVMSRRLTSLPIDVHA